MFEISHADLVSGRNRFPRFAGLSTGLQPVSHCWSHRPFCRKN